MQEIEEDASSLQSVVKTYTSLELRRAIVLSIDFIPYTKRCRAGKWTHGGSTKSRI